MRQALGWFPGSDGTFGARRSGLVAEAAAAVPAVRLCWDMLHGPWGDKESQDRMRCGETPCNIHLL